MSDFVGEGRRMAEMADSRVLDIADAAWLLGFLQKQPAQTHEWFHPFPLDLDSVRRALMDSTQRLSSLWDAGAAVGFWILRDLPAELPEFGLMVNAGHRRRGYGLCMTRIAQDQARRLGKAGLWLSTHPDNTAARRLYDRMGFVETGLMKDGQIIMRWRA